MGGQDLETRLAGDRNLQNISGIIRSLKNCAKQNDLQKGRRLHSDILKRGLLHQNCHVASALVSMYANCGALDKATDVLDELLTRDVWCWNALISGYGQKGHGEEALQLFDRMQTEGLSPDIITYTCILKACGSIRLADKGEKIHEVIVREGLLSKDAMLGASLVDMYVKCGALTKAKQVLDKLPVRNTVSWSSLITGYVHQGWSEDALECFKQMESEGHLPDTVTFTCILKACGSIGVIAEAERIHNEIFRMGLVGKDIILDTALVDMYARFGSLLIAELILDELPVRDVACWNSLITGYVLCGAVEDALSSFERMQHEGLLPNVVTFTCLSKACGSIQAFDKGEQIYNEIVGRGLMGDDIALGNTLVDMYAKCGALEKATHLLDELPIRNVVSWSALIGGYAQKGQCEKALECFWQIQSEGLFPDSITFSSILKACANVGLIESGMQIHDEIIRQGLFGEDVVLGNTLVDMYAKCGALTKAECIVVGLPFRDVVSWSTLITGYAQQGECEEALKCFKWMKREGLSPNAVTFISMLKACGSVSAFDKGEEIHDEIVRHGLSGNVILGNALVDMYAKCGILSKAADVLNELPVQDVVPWNALITGYSLHGQGEKAFECLQQMQHEGISPDAVTLTCLLSACIRSSLIEGQVCFTSVSKKYDVGRDVAHHARMVEIFSRRGEFHEALTVIKKMRWYNHFTVWYALIAACYQHGYEKLGRLAFDIAKPIDKKARQAVLQEMSNLHV